MTTMFLWTSQPTFLRSFGKLCLVRYNTRRITTYGLEERRYFDESIFGVMSGMLLRKSPGMGNEPFRTFQDSHFWSGVLQQQMITT